MAQYMDESQMQSEADAEALARMMEERAFREAFAKTRGQPAPEPAQLDSLGGGESCEGGMCDTVNKILAPIDKYSPMQVHPGNLLAGAAGIGDHPGLPPPMNVAVTGAQRLVNKVSGAFKQRQSPAAVRRNAEKEETSLQGEVNKQVAKGDTGGEGKTKDAPKPKGVSNKYAPDAVTIGRGDTLWGIARQYGMSVDDLVALNGGVDPRRLQIGQQIRLRPEPEVPVAPQDAGPSLLAQKIQAANAAPKPNAFSPFRDVNLNNPYNGNLRDARDTAMNYAGAVAGGAGAAAAPSIIERFLAMLAQRGGQAALPRASDGAIMNNAERMFRARQGEGMSIIPRR
jgi:LysM repeat protein